MAWHKTYKSQQEANEIESNVISAMTSLEMEAYTKDALPAPMTLYKSHQNTTLYIDARGTPRQIETIEKLGFSWKESVLMPAEVELIFQTHEE